MNDSLMDQGLTLMLAGMGTVFVFLTTLVIAMTVMSLLVKRLQATSSDPSVEEVAAISAAIEKHRQR
jgi:oxaloacetate decarboxylase gamma subunit